ncbi:MAG: hypothetical protein ABEK50_15320 [bacterium]
MPTFVRYYIKTALIYFLLSLLIGVLLLAVPVFELSSTLILDLPTYLHLFVVGWITQLIFGVSIWMFPAPDHGGRYGYEKLVWAIYLTLNAGLLLRLIAEPGTRVVQDSLFLNWMLIISALLQWSAGLLYSLHIWGRVKGK